MDNNQKSYNISDFLDTISDDADAPIFTFIDSYFGYGPVGGVMVNAVGYGQHTAAAILLYLSGNAEQIDPDKETTVSVYDWRQLQRWNIDKKLIPAGFEIAFEPENIFHRYKRQIITIVFIIALETILLLILSITLKKKHKAEKSLEKSLAEKEILLQEVHHRVRNNLAIMSSLLMLQLDQEEDVKAKSALLKSRSRIMTMALLHDQLYQENNLEHIPVIKYFNLLIDSITSEKQVISGLTTSINIIDISFGMDILVPLGIIVNEIVSNSLEHAFEGINNPTINISLKSTTGNSYELIIEDNGTGLPDGLNMYEPSSTGFLLIKNLILQIHGQIELSQENGTCYKISFTDNK